MGVQIKVIEIVFYPKEEFFKINEMLSQGYEHYFQMQIYLLDQKDSLTKSETQG